MKTHYSVLSALVLLSASLRAAPITNPPAEMLVAPPVASVVFARIAYDARVTDDEARFVVEVTAESTSSGEATGTLFEGELALLPPKLPPAVRIEREGSAYRLAISRPGRYQCKLELLAKVHHTEPWNQVSFKGPAAAIASLSARADGADVELQLLSGTVLSSVQTNGVAQVKGFLGADQTVALRWSQAGGGADASRKAVVTAETEASAQVTPTVIKYVTQVKYELIQGKLPRLTVALPANHALTRLAGSQIRDWEIKPATGAAAGEHTQVLEIQFIKPLEKQYQLTIYSEQTVDSTPSSVVLAPPQPLELERETGVFTLAAEDTQVEVESAAGLRQVNAAGGTLAAYRFSGRPLALTLRLRRSEPVISVAERVSARVEETRLLCTHTLALTIEKAGVYALDLLPGPDFLVAEVQGEGVEDWKVSEGAPGRERRLRVNFSSRVLGTRQLEVQLEQSLKTFPEKVGVGPLRVADAAKESSEIGAASGAGIRLKTLELAGLREVPVRNLQSPVSHASSKASDELLGFKAEQADWRLSLATERLPARVVADIFNLVTVGDGLVGGSAIIRYGLLNQGVQEFQLAVPAWWKNVEFTGPNIRRKDLQPDGTWRIGLQDKVWGGFTLVVTYDHQFEPKGAVLAVGGIHALGAEHESGSVALTTAASLKLEAKTVSDSLRRVDEMDLSPADRGLITRPVLLAYQYGDTNYNLAIDVKRFEEASVLSAVADRTQMTTVLTEGGEMLTQASFMVKNNDKQFQRFKLPKGARFWSCHVNGQPVKAERDGDWLMAPLPRGANRDQAMAVDIVYAQEKGLKPRLRPIAFTLEAPQTDIPNTYAEWQLFAPPVLRLGEFSGNMTPVRGTTYDLRDAWQKFTHFYWEFLRDAGPGLFFSVLVVTLMVALIGSAIRRGWNGVLSVLVVFAIFGILAGMLLPALSKAKARAQRINAVNSLKQIGLAAKTWSLDNNDRLPRSYEEMMNELSTDKVTYDPESGQRFVYLGAGQEVDKLQQDSVLAYSPTEVRGYRAVLFVDGSVQQLNAQRFDELCRRGLIVSATSQQIAQNQQLAAVRGAQFQTPTAQAAEPAAALNGALMATPHGRAIHIDIPREGQAFTFTKVLNAGREPLTVSLTLMKLQTFQVLQMALQLGAFLGGLAVWGWQWRSRKNAFLLTLGLALSLAGVGSLLVAWRMLHLAFIWAAPVALLAMLAWLTWRFWPRPQAGQAPAKAGFEPGLPPVVAALVLLAVSIASSDAAVRSRATHPVIPESRASAVSILSATYTGTVSDGVARLQATLQVRTTQPTQSARIFGEEVAVEDFSAKPAEAKLLREGNAVVVFLPRAGEATLQLKMLVKVGGDVTRRELAFGIPSALTSQFALTVEQPEAAVEFPAAISLKHTGTNQATRVEAVLGSGDRVDLFWTPRVKRAAEITANVLCHNTAMVTFGNGVVNVRATLDYQVTQGEMRQARVRLPERHRLLRVEGESIRNWELKTDPGGPEIVVELVKGIAPNYRLTVETEQLLPELPATVRAEVPHAADVKRETGLVALRGAEELEVALDHTAELSRVDVEEFARLTGKRLDGALNAFRFLKPEFVLETRVSALRPQIEAMVRQHVRVGQEQVGLTADLDYAIKRTGVFELELALPEGYRLERVTGTNILQWLEQPRGAQHIVQVTLKERTSGDYRLNLELSQSLKVLPKLLAIGGVHPLGAQKLTGLISVSVEPGVALKPAESAGLTEIPASAVAGLQGSANGGVLAYKFIASGEQPAPGWRLSVETEVVESWVRAEIVNALTLGEMLVSGRAVARFDIQNAPVKELRLKIPASFQNIEIAGANIRRRDHDGESWKVEFQGKIRGPHVLTVTWEEPRAGKTNYVELRGIGAEQVERETGIMTVIARPPLQVVERSAGDLKPIDLRDLPEWAGQPEDATVLAYRYVRPGYRLGLEARRFEEAETLQALVENMKLSTVVADDGQMMTSMSLSVRNQGRQHLELTLPDGATVWSAFVSGQPIRPSVREGKLLLPLAHSVGDDAPVALELVYVSARPFPTRRGALQLTSPTLDAPLKSARWELFLPPEYAYGAFGGTMTHEVETALIEPSGFSLLDYSSRESKNKAEQAQELNSELSSAKRKLSSGNVKDALTDYNRARAKNDLALARNAEARQLEADLRHAQGSNLIQAQNDFTVSNNGKAQEPQPLAGKAPPVQYDAAAAEAQWTKLQQSQELGLMAIQPIRVNLPTRGLRHSFNQVLQTEVGKPLTIRLLAANSHLANWPARLLGSFAGFGVLWLGVSLLARRVPRRREAIAR